MTPAEVAGITAIAAILKELGSWPVVLVLALIQISPWLLLMIVSRSVEKRHSEVVQMYENNVILVQNYESATERWEAISNSLVTVVSLNTQAQTRLVDAVKNNEFCPAVREKGPNRS